MSSTGVTKNRWAFFKEFIGSNICIKIWWFKTRYLRFIKRSLFLKVACRPVNCFNLFYLNLRVIMEPVWYFLTSVTAGNHLTFNGPTLNYNWSFQQLEFFYSRLYMLALESWFILALLGGVKYYYYYYYYYYYWSMLSSSLYPNPSHPRLDDWKLIQKSCCLKVCC